MNLSPYAFSKAKNLELLENLRSGLIFDMKLFTFIMFMEKDKFAKVIWQQLLVYLKIILREVKNCQ
jgi:hypothetical protein